jgi:hypothetical protein
MSVIESTRSFEHCLGEQIDVVPSDLARKHERMDENSFTFIRATHYHWLQKALELVLRRAPSCRQACPRA